MKKELIQGIGIIIGAIGVVALVVNHPWYVIIPAIGAMVYFGAKYLG